VACPPAFFIRRDLEIHQINDGTLERFVADRVASGVTATTINRSLEVVRLILIELYAPIVVTMPGVRCWRPHLR
jgi:hypothetical protein